MRRGNENFEWVDIIYNSHKTATKKNTFPHTVAKRRATRKLQQKKSPPKNPTVLIKDGGAPGKKKPEIKLVSSAGNIQFCIASK